MKKLFTSLRDIAVAGLLFLLPLYIAFILLSRVWAPLSSMGTKTARLLGMNSLLGVPGSSIFAVLLLVVTWLAVGLLVRFSFMAAFERAAERWLSKNIPGYDAYKALAKDKLHLGAKVLPYAAAALIRRQEGWQPAFIIEHDANGNYVVFLPEIPDTGKGQVLLVKQDQVLVLSSLTADQLDVSLKNLGNGLLSKHLLSDGTFSELGVQVRR